MRLLVDMDGVVADWGAAWDFWVGEFGEAAANLPRHAQQTTFNLNEGRTAAERKIIAQIFSLPRFYASLDPIPGARTALRKAAKAGHDIRFVTSPWVSNPTCASDKLNWIVKYYGAHWGQKVIITTDKTLVHGDILIDDKPEVHGSIVPTWEHVLFTQPYNVNITDKRRITAWTELEGIIND